MTMKTKNSSYNEFSFLVGQLVRKLNLLNRDQKICYGLTMPQCYTIETLAQKGMFTMNKLSREMGVSISTMTRIIDILVRDEVVWRKTNPEDRRQVCIKLTVKGRNLASKLKRCSEKYSKEVLNQVPVGKRKEIIESLETLNSAIKEVNKKCCR